MSTTPNAPKNYATLKSISAVVALLSAAAMLSVIIFILKESLPFLTEEGAFALLAPGKWRPTGNTPSYSVFNLMLASFYIFGIAIAIALPVSLGTALCVRFYLPQRLQAPALRLIGILAGIPSVIMGFIGLMVVVKCIERGLHLSGGESILAGGLVVSAMIIPFIVNAVADSARMVIERHRADSEALGISTEYFIRAVALPALGRSIAIGTILAFSRVIGETMAVMMVIGNAPIFPTLLGKAETIPGLIALEMGMAEVGSTHYSALFASGLVLLIAIGAVNLLVEHIRKRSVSHEM